MTRNECEEQIAKKMMEIQEIYHQYNGKGDYINLTVTNEYISCVNKYYDDDYEKPIDFRQYAGEPLQSRKHGEDETV